MKAMTRYYVLDVEFKPVPADDVRAWLRWIKTHNCRVDTTDISATITVATVFVGVGQVFHRTADGAPLLFETTVFGPDGAVDQFLTLRTATWEQAQDAHGRAVAVAQRWVSQADHAISQALSKSYEP